MTTVAIIPDQHGEDNWKKVLGIKADYYVSLGDWFDSFTIDYDTQMQNFTEFIDFVKQDPEHRIALLGNHDLAYLQPANRGMLTSGHDIYYHDDIHELILSNIRYLQIYFNIDGIVFSHAGFSKKWVERWMREDLNDNIMKHLLSLSFINPTSILNAEDFNEYGDNTYQSPLWIRPYSLLHNSAYPIQIVGHTEMCSSAPIYAQYDNNKVIFCDSPHHNLIFTINTDEIKKMKFDFDGHLIERITNDNT